MHKCTSVDMHENPRQAAAIHKHSLITKMDNPHAHATPRSSMMDLHRTHCIRTADSKRRSKKGGGDLRRTMIRMLLGAGAHLSLEALGRVCAMDCDSASVRAIGQIFARVLYLACRTLLGNTSANQQNQTKVLPASTAHMKLQTQDVSYRWATQD